MRAALFVLVAIGAIATPSPAQSLRPGTAVRIHCAGLSDTTPAQRRRTTMRPHARPFVLALAALALIAASTTVAQARPAGVHAGARVGVHHLSLIHI